MTTLEREQAEIVPQSPVNKTNPILVPGFLGLTLVLALVLFWKWRHHIFWDGISYLEIAQTFAVNAYWSPLYSWAVAPAVHLLDTEWHSTAAHFAQVIFAVLAVYLTFRLAQRLFPELSHQPGWIVTVWTCGAWAALGLCGVNHTNADLLVLVLFLLIALFTIGDHPIALGVTLGFAYLAKSAMLPFGILLLALRAWQKRGKTLHAALAFAGVSLPWILAISLHSGHVTFSDSGPLNYAWEVGTVRRWMHWQGGPEGYGTPIHPTRQIHQNPDVFVFDSPIRTSYAPWFEPSYWYQGLRPKIDLQRQIKFFGINFTVALWNLISAPGLLASVVLIGRIRSWKGFCKEEITAHWPLLASTVALVLMYSLVFLDRRYVAGPLLLLALVLLAEIARRSGKVGLRLIPIAAVAMLVWSLVFDVFAGAQAIVMGDGPNPHAVLAKELAAKQNVPKGARFAVIGLGPHGEWARIGGMRIIGEIGPVFEWTAAVPRSLVTDTDNVDRFWALPRDQQDQILQSFHQQGADYAIATIPPVGKDPAGWTLLQSRLDQDHPDGRVYFRRLIP